jgi:hypothetical protein
MRALGDIIVIALLAVFTLVVMLWLIARYAEG